MRDIGQVRNRQSLDGAWDFRHGKGEWRTAHVPAPWQAEFADLRHSFGKAIYRRNVRIQNTIDTKQLFICFGAVSERAVVRFNGVELGRHEGGYLPFEFSIPSSLLRGENWLEVECDLPDGEFDNVDGVNFSEYPHGKQSWYGPIGGIWQSVYLEERADVHIRTCSVIAAIDGRVEVGFELSQPHEARISVLCPNGSKVAEGVSTLSSLVLKVDSPELWSPEHPALYSVMIETAEDAIVKTFGFRTFEARDGRLFLNGRPFYMRAALDQDYYPEGICTPPSVKFLENQLLRAKELGLNMLRCHIKVPDPRYYEVADRLGMLIWTEIPNVATLTSQSAARLRDTMRGILARDGHHPCIVIWTLINEDWGTRLCEDPEHRRWLAREFDWLKQRDPTRLVVDNSPCHGNFHVKSDINDFHYYRSVPERRLEWDALTREFAKGADWTYEPGSEGSRRGDEPLIVSEFGVWGLPDPKKVMIQGQEPWWMETGGTWGDGVAYPHGVQSRFDQLQLGKIFETFDKFIEAAQWYQFANLQYEIAEMRAYDSIQGYVITEFTDVHWESNGLLDMNRNPRAFHQKFIEINDDLSILLRVDRYGVWAGDEIRIPVQIATGGVNVSDAILRWSAGDVSGEFEVRDLPALSSKLVGEIVFPAPIIATSTMLKVTAELLHGAKVATKNSVDLAVYSRRIVAPRPTIASRNPDLLAHFENLGYSTVEIDRADVVIASSLTASDIAEMQKGKRYLVLADGTDGRNLRKDQPKREQPFIPIVDEIPGLPQPHETRVPNMVLHERHGTIWRGDWIAGFSWLRRDGAYAGIPGGPLFDLSFDRVVPHHVLTGFRTWEFGSAVRSGIVVGWVHKPAAFIAQRRIGLGALLVTTFRLRTDTAGVDPVATALAHALVEDAAEMNIF